MDDGADEIIEAYEIPEPDRSGLTPIDPGPTPEQVAQDRADGIARLIALGLSEAQARAIAGTP